jgi:hypothetical protein
MVFNLCSSAGVHGVFVLLFFAGGPMGEDAVGSSAPPEGPAALDEADIGSTEVPCPDARLLFLAPGGDVVSGLPEVSAVVVRVCEGEIPEADSSSVRSARLDIGDGKGGDAQVPDIEISEIKKAGEKGQIVAREL